MPGRRNKSKVQAKPIRVDPLRLVQLLRRRRYGAFAIVLFLIIAIACIDRVGGVLPVDDDWHRYHGKRFEVVRVVDGDTLHVRMADGDEATTKIRLWGVDTPELNRSSDEPAEPWAQAASDFAHDRLEGQSVTLYLQEHRLRGGFGRLLAYVTLDDGGVFNAELIEKGYTEHDDRWSHDRSDEFEAIEMQARQEEVGVWMPKKKAKDLAR